MKAEELIKDFREQTILGLRNATDTVEKDLLMAMILGLREITFVLRAISEEFYTNVEDIPECVYLFDKERNMFWKGSHGYTNHIMDAGIFSKEKAINKVEDDFNNTTKIVFF